MQAWALSHSAVDLIALHLNTVGSGVAGVGLRVPPESVGCFVGSFVGSLVSSLQHCAWVHKDVPQLFSAYSGAYLLPSSQLKLNSLHSQFLPMQRLATYSQFGAFLQFVGWS